MGQLPNYLLSKSEKNSMISRARARVCIADPEPRPFYRVACYGNISSILCLDTKISGIPCVAGPVQKLLALIVNPRSSQQLMGQLPKILCCLKAKKIR